MTRRNYGIELLRLVLMYMVCVLHTLGQGGILSRCTEGTVPYYVYWLMEVGAYCAVDGFAIITGYTAKNTTPKTEKIIQMWFQVFFYSFVVPLILAMVGVPVNATATEWRDMMFPLTFSMYWYFSAYVGLFFAMPLLNKYLFALDETAAKKALLVILVVFTLGSRFNDPFSLMEGYSAIWLMILYSIGVLAKRVRFMEKMRIEVLMLLWTVLIVVTWMVYSMFDTKTIPSYVSPTIVLAGLTMVVLFSKFRLSGKCISKIVPLAFGIYLLQNNAVIWRFLDNRFVFAASLPVVEGVACVVGGAFGIFAVGLAVEYVRKLLEKWLQIPALTQKIAGWITAALNWVCGKAESA